MVFVNTENRPGWEDDVRSLKKMFHEMNFMEADVKIILNPVLKVRFDTNKSMNAAVQSTVCLCVNVLSRYLNAGSQKNNYIRKEWASVHIRYCLIKVKLARY